MTQPVNQETLRSQIAAWWREAARDLPAAMERLGVHTLYGLLTASAFVPLVQAYSPDNPGPAIRVLARLTASVGANLITNLVQNAYDRAAPAPQIEQEVATSPDLRAEYAQVLNGLNVVSAAQTALGEQWAAFAQQLQEELRQERFTLTLDTGGGAVVWGSIYTEGGDVALRDFYKTIVNPAQDPPQELLRAYYRDLARECRQLPLGVVDPQFARPGQESRVPLDEVYIDLDVVSPVRAAGDDPRSWGLRLARGEGEGRTALLDALAAPEAARVVLLGEAGSGKTTFVNYLTAALAQQAAGGAPVAGLPDALAALGDAAWPLRFILRDVATRIPEGATCGAAALLWNTLHDDFAARLGKAGADRLLPYVQARVLRRGALVLLDGLDEAPEAGKCRACLLQAIAAFAGELPPKARLVLTARPYAYADPDWQLANLPILSLAPFNERQIERFVARWYQAARLAIGVDAAAADDRARRLARALQERAYLADLASRPLLLTLMATLHTSGGQLPEDRADLYEESVKLLLSRWQRNREVRGANGQPLPEPGIAATLKVGEERIRAVLENLAYDSHTRQGGEAQRQDAPADIPRSDVVDAFASEVPSDVNPLVVLDYLEHRAGLLVGRREAVYAFPHRSFQEYLTACHLTNTEADVAERLCELAQSDPAWWQEVLLLGVGKLRQGGLSNAVNVLNTLAPGFPDRTLDPRWQLAALAGEAALEMRLPEKAAGRRHLEVTLDRVRAWQVAIMAGGHLTVRARSRAGDVLGYLGDPRPGVASPEGIPNIAWCKVPAGPFLMGSADDDPDAYADEKPQHTLELPEYYISQYPITNAQYRPFVESGGYDDETLWMPEGWAWRNGAEADLSVYEGVDKDWVQQYREWLAGRPVAKRAAPFWWDDPAWGAPNRPVVGVTWHEATAYCRWLTQCARKHPAVAPEDIRKGPFAARLPSEAEWEKAARGVAGRRFPWGNTWDAARANTEEGELGHTSPVGLFPTGASPYTVLDMAGNVWEWTRSRWGDQTVLKCDYDYPYQPGDGRERQEGMRIPVLRGGSYYSDKSPARCGFRVRHVVDLFYSGDGFRVMVSLVSCGSGF